MLDDMGAEMDPMKENQSRSTYLSYLLRLWRVNNAGQPVCRASLEAPGSQTQIHFESLAALCDYLATEIGIIQDETAVDNQKKGEE